MAVRGTPTQASGTGTTPAVAVPTGAQAGDQAYIAITGDNTAWDFTSRLPSGFTLLRQHALTGDGQTVAFAWKRLTGADTGSYSCSANTGSADWVMACMMLSGRHASAAPAIGASSFSNTKVAGPVSLAAAGVTAVTGDDLVYVGALDVDGSDRANGYTPPSTFTEAVDAELGWSSLEIAYKLNVSSGATGTATATGALSSGTAGWAAALIRVPAAATGTTYDRSGATVAASETAGSVQRTRFRDRGGAVASDGVVSASGNKVNPTSNRGTVAVGRISPVRSGAAVAAVALSGSRSVGSAATYSRAGATVSAAAPAASRSVTPIGTTSARSGTVAFGRVPIVRSGATAAKVVTAVSRVVGSPGATFDRVAAVVVGRIAQARSGVVAARAKLSGSVVLTPRGTIDRSGGGAGGAGAASSGGLLITLVTHPGPTLSASVRVDSNVPLRTGAVASAAVMSGSRVTRRDRSGVIVSDVATSGVRVSSGNRNRNGAITVEGVPQGEAVKVLTSAVSGVIVSDAVTAASGGVTFAVAYSRSAVLVVPISTRAAGSLVSDVILHMSFGAPAGRVTVAPTGIL